MLDLGLPLEPPDRSGDSCASSAASCHYLATHRSHSRPHVTRKFCLHHLHSGSNTGQFWGGREQQPGEKKIKTKRDYLITVWLFFPGINTRAEKKTVIESELIKVLLAKAEQKIEASAVVGPPTTVCRYISSDLSLRCSFKG